MEATTNNSIEQMFMYNGTMNKVAVIIAYERGLWCPNLE